MIRICERCYGYLSDLDEHVGLAHIDHALPDGSILWRYSYLHSGSCETAGRGRSPAEGPDTGEWDRRFGISPATLGWIARRDPHADPAAAADLR